MIKCQTCGAAYILGTLFCTDCGASLFNSVRDGAAKPFRFVHFLILDNRRKQRIPISATEPIAIGRADPDAGYWPQLDLTDDGGVTKGVSRQHAVLRVDAENVYLIDHGSKNGTWIDNVRLEPQQPNPLPVSGRVRFGKLDVHIFIE
jgi:pSer/pThr/pTyr-binding forkhead associated (FHA) protein